VEDNLNNRNDPSPSASNEAFLEDNQRVTYAYTVSADVIRLLRVVSVMLYSVLTRQPSSVACPYKQSATPTIET
jgi:hypothetical protein